MKKVIPLLVGFVVFLMQNASAQLIESFENTLDGWAVPPSYNAQPYTTSFSTTTGVTDGSYSLAVTGTAAPNYGQLLASPSYTQLTSLLGNAASLSFDVYAPAGSFGGYLQFDIDINNADTGFQSLDGYSYIAASFGAESTITVPVSSSLQLTLAASSNPTSMDIQVGGGYTAGNETFYIDNIRVTPVPEPATMALVGLGVAGLALLRRRNV